MSMSEEIEVLKAWKYIDLATLRQGCKHVIIWYRPIFAAEESRPRLRLRLSWEQLGAGDSWEMVQIGRYTSVQFDPLSSLPVYKRRDNSGHIRDAWQVYAGTESGESLFSGLRGGKITNLHNSYPAGDPLVRELSSTSCQDRGPRKLFLN
ncbi:hypothetical protein P170DRAFT_199826 [Aspergillus steynii IBT 23096]|uniref:Uncharacterized protein n=1 Tax=Aspergillus steynii IBT 23096 TaxID=1392250 RepID=A0A2I2G4U4_9EURO|nr:uncharacterized protein P170DRAFT_199826 [Aspergillus steynii IBT 23096]PLB47900.1 hypothetical protein P170DRAFT_199826 [Aspergillus steynii IBT 23096]